MSDCGGEEEKRESSLESSCQSMTDWSESLSSLSEEDFFSVFSDEPGPSHSRVIKDAGGVGSMSTAGPPSATGMRKGWHEDMRQNLRYLWVDRLVRYLPLTPDRVADARKIEGDIYESANSRDEYYHLLAEKLYKIQKKRRKQQRLSLKLRSTSRSQSLIRQPPDFSRLSRGRRTKLHQSADKTEVNSPSPWARTREATHSLIKDAGGVGSMSTAGPPSATGMRKRWHEDITQNLRYLWVHKLVRVLTTDLVADARKIEGDIYKSANSRDEYYHLLAEKIIKIQEEKRTLQRLSLDLWSTSRSQSSIRQPPYFSRLSRGRRTKLHQSADKTEVNSPIPNRKQREMMAAEALNSLIKDAGEVGSMSTAGPPSATGMRKRCHVDITQNRRDRWVDRLVRYLPLTPDLVVNARKIEGDIYESANSIDEYYYLLREKINKFQEEKRTLQRLSLDLESTSRSQSPIKQPPASTSVSASSSSALPTQPSASQPTTAEEGATTQRDAGSTAINAKNGSVISHPHLKDVHITGDVHINFNTPSGQTRARTDQTNVEEHGGEQR